MIKLPIISLLLRIKRSRAKGWSLEARLSIR